MEKDQIAAFENLDKAQQAMKSGDMETARNLAAQAARLAPEFEEVWLLMAALSSPRGSMAYLHKALKINPRSERAKKGLLWAEGRIKAQQESQALSMKQIDISNTELETQSAKPDEHTQNSTGVIHKSEASPDQQNHRAGFPKINLPPFVQFVIRRTLTVPVSLVIITMLLYAGMMLTPPTTRARLYLPPGKGGERATEQKIQVIIKTYHLDDPYLVQYGYWAKSMLQGGWGYSPIFNGEVLPALLHRTPATAELALYSMLVFIPLGLISGVLAGWRQRQAGDNAFRFLAFLFTSLPPFILSMILIAFFYINLDWFAPERLSTVLSYKLETQNFQTYTGMYTIDGLLNNRLDVSIDALRHLAMPVMTLVLYHWATMARITRVATIAEKRKEYMIAARARGVREHQLAWKHAFRNVLAPTFTSLALSAASLVTGIFVVEMIFSYKGISDLIVKSMQGTPDAAAALGFSVYSVLIVLTLMFFLDMIQAAVDPRIREEVLRS